MPPRLAERVMRWSLSPDDRPAVLGDLQEEFESIVAGGSVAAARRWYWRQALTSAAPNFARRARQAYLRECGSPEARAAQGQARRSSYWFIGLGAAMLVIDRLIFVHAGRSIATVAIPLEIGLIFLFFSFFETGVRRRPKPGEALIQFLVLGGWAWATLNHEDARFPLGMIAISSLLQRWPRGLWPVPARRQPPSYSVRTPVLTFRQADGSLYATTSVPTEPMAMDRPIVGRATPATIPAEDVVTGIVPLTPVLTRSFPATESIRIFSVLNADSNLVTATLEVRALPEDRVVRRVPVTARPATPKLPARVIVDLDEAVRPRLSKSPMSELDVIVPLAGLTPGRYDLRIVATEGTLTSSQDEEIVVTAPVAGGPGPPRPPTSSSSGI